MKNRILAALAAFALALVGALFVSSPAQAAWSACSNGYVCLFTGTNGSGTLYQRTIGSIWQAPAHCWDLGDGGAENSTSSVWNRSGFRVYLHDSHSCIAGNRNTVAAGQQINLSSFNDKASSVLATNGQ